MNTACFLSCSKLDKVDSLELCAGHASSWNPVVVENDDGPTGSVTILRYAFFASTISRTTFDPGSNPVQRVY